VLNYLHIEHTQRWCFDIDFNHQDGRIRSTTLAGIVKVSSGLRVISSNYRTLAPSDKTTYVTTVFIYC
jgi:hypothetical protein